MREIITKAPYVAFKVNGEAFKIDMSPSSKFKFQRLWPGMLARLDKAISEVEKIGSKIKDLPENVADKTEEEQFAELDKLVELQKVKIDGVLAVAKEIINFRLLDKPYEKIFELCYGDIDQLTGVIIAITELVKENSK